MSIYSKMHLCLFVPLQQTNTIFHPIAIFLNQLIKQDSIVRVNRDTWRIFGNIPGIYSPFICSLSTKRNQYNFSSCKPISFNVYSLSITIFLPWKIFKRKTLRCLFIQDKRKPTKFLIL